MKHYDIVIEHGRAIDIESDLDEICNVGIKDGVIRELSQETLQGDERIDATGMAVTAGFIDPHTHEDPLSILFDKRFHDALPITDTGTALLRTGVTTMIGGNCGLSAYPLGTHLNHLSEGGLPVNYGSLLGYNSLRNGLGIDIYAHLGCEYMQKIESLIEDALKNDALGVSFGLEYGPGITQEEMMKTAELVKRYGKFLSVHMRHDYPEKALETVEEVLRVVRETGVSLQISHLTANVYGDDNVKRVLEMIHRANSDGLDVSADIYPYDAWGTSLQSAVFDEGLEHFNFTYEDIEIITGEHAGNRCTKELFENLRSRDEEIMVVTHNAIPVRDIIIALQDPVVMVCSDATMSRDPDTGNYRGHPRAAGSQAKLLGDMVREKKWITLKEALTKITLLPAMRLSLPRKGRLQIGCDADITIFHPGRIIDRSTYGDNLCANPPEGIQYVLVHGTIACKNGRVLSGDSGKILSA